MSAMSPAPNNNKVAEPGINIPTINGSATPQRLASIETPKLNQRGHNKPKCIKCGNVARSRCPFQSCKNCCAKAQNPCHIHVLKQTSILPDKPPPSTTPLPEQPSPDVSSSTGATLRLSALRQLSATFANSMRVKKPLTRKDAMNINRWRFLKLKEHIDGNIEAENEAFDRYVWNVGLLEETFSTEGPKPDGQTLPETTPEEKFQSLVSAIKVKLRHNRERAESCRESTRGLVNYLLKRMNEGDNEVHTNKEPKRAKREGERRAERTETFSELIDKLSKARTEDDLKSCMELKLQLLNPSEEKDVDSLSDLDRPFEEKFVDTLGEANGSDEPKADELMFEPKQEPESKTDWSFSLPKMCTVVHIDDEVVSNINADVSSLCQLAEL